MAWGGPNFIVIIVAICTAGWIANNWIKARRGYPIEAERGGKTAKLRAGNSALRRTGTEVTTR